MGECRCDPLPALDSFVAFANTLADEASEMMTSGARNALGLSVKADKTFVTSLDLAIEARLRERIAAQYPAHGVWGEEFAANNVDADWVWTLDPIDGTMALVAGIPVYSTLIALAYQGAPVVGVMHFPATAERWVGARGHATTRNGNSCATRGGVTLTDAVMTASNPDFFVDAPEKAALATLTDRTAWRVYGTAAMAYGRLTSGRTDLALDAGLKIYDFAPFVPIVEGAGGVISDWAGRPLHLHSGGRVLASANAVLHAEVLSTLKPLVQKVAP